MTFPANNLPTASRNWAREVEKKVTNLEGSFRSAEVNNVTRDSQLSVTANAALTAATQAKQAAEDVQAVIDNIYVPNTSTIDGDVLATNTINGAKVINGTLPAGKIQVNSITASQISGDYVYAGSISAGQIQAGTVSGLSITGGTLNTTPSSLRSVTVSGSSAEFKYNGITAGLIESDTAGNAYQPKLKVLASGTSSGGWSVLLGDLGVVNSSTSSNVGILGTTNIYLPGNSGLAVASAGSARFLQGVEFDAGSVHKLSIENGRLESKSDFRCNGELRVGNDMYYNAAIGTGTSFPLYSNTSSNLVYRLSSSARYKTDIQDASFDYEKLLQARVRTFKNKKEAEEVGVENAELTYGYIAEELHDLGLTDFVVYENDETGNPRPESVNYMSMALATHEMLKVQDQKLKSLEARLEALESR